MTQRRFFTYLGLVSALVAGLFLILHSFTSLAAFQGFSWLCLAIFIFFNILIFYSGKQSAQSADKNAFTRLMLGVSFGKMLLAIIVIFTYVKLFQPQDKIFLVPFFLAYLFYTGYEVYFMMRLGRE